MPGKTAEKPVKHLYSIRDNNCIFLHGNRHDEAFKVSASQLPPSTLNTEALKELDTELNGH